MPKFHAKNVNFSWDEDENKGHGTFFPEEEEGGWSRVGDGGKKGGRAVSVHSIFAIRVCLQFEPA